MFSIRLGPLKVSPVYICTAVAPNLNFSYAVILSSTPPKPITCILFLLYSFIFFKTLLDFLNKGLPDIPPSLPKEQPVF